MGAAHSPLSVAIQLTFRAQSKQRASLWRLFDKDTALKLVRASIGGYAVSLACDSSRKQLPTRLG